MDVDAWDRRDAPGWIYTNRLSAGGRAVARPDSSSGWIAPGRTVQTSPMADRSFASNDQDDVERLVRLGSKELTWPEVCARAGVDSEVADVLWRALGFPDVSPEEPAYTNEDVRALAIAAEGIDRLHGDRREAAVEAIVREARMVSAHLTRIAEIEVEAMAEIR